MLFRLSKKVMTFLDSISSGVFSAADNLADFKIRQLSQKQFGSAKLC